MRDRNFGEGGQKMHFSLIHCKSRHFVLIYGRDDAMNTKSETSASLKLFFFIPPVYFRNSVSRWNSGLMRKDLFPSFPPSFFPSVTLP